VSGPRAAEAAVTRRRRRRRGALAGVSAGLALVVAALLAGPSPDGPALDPRSVQPDGLRGLVEVAESMGVQVDISSDVPDDTSVHVFVPQDRLGEQEREALRDWARRGGRLVVSDPSSALHDLEAAGQPVSDMVGPSARTPDCPVDALSAVGSVSHGGWVGFDAGDDDVGCFEGAEGPWLVERAEGEGTLVVLGSPAPLVNRSLDRDDNAVLAAALLFPAADGRLQVLPPDGAGARGEREGTEPDGPVAVADLVPPRVVSAVAVAVLAVGLALLAVGRRLGRPVEERLPPTVPSAELARSVGDLLQRSGRRNFAAARLRGEARREVGRVLGVPLEPEPLAHEAHRRLGIDLGSARRALVDLDLSSDDDLVAVASAVVEVRDRLGRAT
jgi:hypothetical protein